MTGKYNDIIHLPHHVSKTRRRMTMAERAAQFSPFAALVGYDDEVKETARLTDSKVELDEYEIAAIDVKLQVIREKLSEKPEVEITYFKPDRKKSGGAYATVSGRVKKIDSVAGVVVMEDGSSIPIGDIVEVAGSAFSGMI